MAQPPSGEKRSAVYGRASARFKGFSHPAALAQVFRLSNQNTPGALQSFSDGSFRTCLAKQSGQMPWLKLLPVCSAM